MENYKLKSDEVVLYKGNVSLVGNSGATEIVLTNTNLVFISTYKKLFSKEEISVLEYSIEDIKMYENKPHIISKGNKAEIYLIDNEIVAEFSSKNELHKFLGVINKLLTGETSAQRGAKKIRGAIDLVDEALGINTVEAIGNVIKNGVVNSVTGAVGKIGKAITSKKK